MKSFLISPKSTKKKIKFITKKASP
jgi:hypothetical protein